MLRKHLLRAGLVLPLVLPAALGTALAQDAKQGGSMVVTYKDDISTLDPAIGYDWQNWSMIKSLFDGLMDYKPGTTDLVPDLAESYEVAPDGLSYTFKLRKGVKFHNGRELTADDVKWSIDRAVQPETQSPGQGFFNMIAGFADVTSGKAKELSGIEVVDPYTARFTLSHPDATFLHVMALNFGFAVPKEEVEKYGQDFGKHPVGTGAYKMTEWTLGQRVVFERNPDHYKKGLPKLDKITFEIGQEPLVALLRLERGEVDILGDGIPPAKFLEVMNDPSLKKNVVKGGQLHTGYVTMNVKLKPFDNKLVRQAVNHAINKDRVIKIINGRAVPANQPLPPAMPGYDPDYKGYAYDPAKAKALLAEAGLRERLRYRALRHEHRPQPAHRPGDPAGSGRGRHPRRAQDAGPGERDRGRRRREGGADDLVGRHGLDRRLPGPVRLLRPDPGVRGRGAGRLELVLVLQPGARQEGDRGGRDHRPGQVGGAPRGLARHLHPDHGRCALGAGVQRAAVHDEGRPPRRPRRDLRRSRAHPGQL